jgi:hypothetical protein
MLAHVQLTKYDMYTHGESWEIEILDMENPKKPKFKTKISEYEAIEAVKSFSNCEKFGQFNQHEKWT